jgi:hypothetical protein
MVHPTTSFGLCWDYHHLASELPGNTKKENNQMEKENTPQYRLQITLLLHGTVMLFIGLLAGVPLMIAINREWGPFATHIWAVTHTSVTIVGVCFIAISGAFDHLVHGKFESTILVGSLLLCAWTFTPGLVLAGIFGVQGLKPQGPPANWVVFILFVIGAFAMVFGSGVMILGAQRALRVIVLGSMKKPKDS